VVTDLDRSAILQGIARIQSSIEAMDAHLNEILESAQDQSNQPDHDVDLWNIAEQLVEQYNPLAKNHELIVFGCGAGQAVGTWDTRSIERIVVNFLSNALKYSPAGGLVMIVVEKEGGEARIGVVDHGIGIPCKMLPHIFEQYYRGRNVGDQPTTSDVSGLGLGLFAAQQLASQLNSRIDVTSRIRQGSSFTLVLPLDDKCQSGNEE
jgi:signal transduction histidine kinase